MGVRGCLVKVTGVRGWLAKVMRVRGWMATVMGVHGWLAKVTGVLDCMAKATGLRGWLAKALTISQVTKVRLLVATGFSEGPFFAGFCFYVFCLFSSPKQHWSCADSSMPVWSSCAQQHALNRCAR